MRTATPLLDALNKVQTHLSYLSAPDCFDWISGGHPAPIKHTPLCRYLTLAARRGLKRQDVEVCAHLRSSLQTLTDIRMLFTQAKLIHGVSLLGQFVCQQANLFLLSKACLHTLEKLNHALLKQCITDKDMDPNVTLIEFARLIARADSLDPCPEARIALAQCYAQLAISFDYPTTEAEPSRLKAWINTLLLIPLSRRANAATSVSEVQRTQTNHCQQAILTLVQHYSAALTLADTPSPKTSTAEPVNAKTTVHRPPHPSGRTVHTGRCPNPVTGAMGGLPAGALVRSSIRWCAA